MNEFCLPMIVIERRHFSAKSDVWSFGIVLYEIFEFGKVPYSTMSNSDTMEFVLSGKRLEKPSICPEQVYKLMLQCWDLDAEKRPSFKTLFDQLKLIGRVVKSVGVGGVIRKDFTSSQSIYHSEAPVTTIPVHTTQPTEVPNYNSNQ